MRCWRDRPRDQDLCRRDAAAQEAARRGRGRQDPAGQGQGGGGQGAEGAIASGEPGGKPPEGNIALVTQNYDKLNAALGPDVGDDKEAGKAAPAQDSSGKAAGKK